MATSSSSSNPTSQNKLSEFAPKYSPPVRDGIEVERAVTIRRPVQEIYSFWRKLENLPTIMRHLCAVKVLSEKKSHWEADALAGKVVRWDAEILEDKENELITWKSIEGSEVECSGTVRFHAVHEGEETELRVKLRYNPPGGKLANAVAKLLRRDAQAEVEEDLAHFKQFMETGEVATVEGQSSGRKEKKVS